MKLATRYSAAADVVGVVEGRDDVREVVGDRGDVVRPMSDRVGSLLTDLHAGKSWETNSIKWRNRDLGSDGSHQHLCVFAHRSHFLVSIVFLLQAANIPNAITVVHSNYHTTYHDCLQKVPYSSVIGRGC